VWMRRADLTGFARKVGSLRSGRVIDLRCFWAAFPRAVPPFFGWGFVDSLHEFRAWR